MIVDPGRGVDFSVYTGATANLKGKVTSRIVLLKKFNKSEGFVFYTHYKSVKGKQLQENPYASIVVFWDLLNRQIRIEGKCHLLSVQKTQEYFSSRARESQIGAWASKQSEEMKNQMQLLENYSYYENFFLNQKEIPLPEGWGGIALIPSSIEFWQMQDYRLHDRLQFYKKKNRWQAKLLFP